MHILWIVLIGFVIGVLAKWILPGRDPGAGFLATSLVGILGSVIAHVIGRAGGWYEPGEPAGFIASVLGAVLLLALWRTIARYLPPPRDLPPAA